MDKIAYTNGPGEDGHPAEDDLILYIDGGLPSKPAASLRAHLEVCWSCRARAEKIQEAISAFVDYRDQVLTPLVEPAPNQWHDFESRLSRLAAASGSRSLLSHLLGSLGAFFSARRWIARPRLSGLAWARVAAA